MVRRRLTGWGRSTASVAEVRAPRDVEEVVSAIRGAGDRGVLVRGLGRSYGDAAQNGGGVVLDLSALAGVRVNGTTVRLGAGARLHDVIEALLPIGLFVPVTPGTRQVSVGGMLAADVHGKNHHRDGSWGHHTTAIEMVTGSGDVRTLRADDSDPAAFWATVGGMGLTGAILAQEVTARPVETAWMCVTTRNYPNLDELMAGLREADATAPYSVAWLDSVGRMGSLGRGILSTGRHAVLDDLTPKQRSRALSPLREARIGVPPVVPDGLLTPLTVGAFNEVWWRISGRPLIDSLQHVGAFFHPLDAVRDWNRVYGRTGMVQYQFVVPDGAEHVVEEALVLLRDAGAPSFLSVLKRFGPANPAPLSFPMPGWTLALDLPAANPRLGAVLDRLDRRVLDHGGRFYLAKDARMTPHSFAAGYPDLAAWRDVRDRLDPEGRFASDQDRRLSIARIR